MWNTYRNRLQLPMSKSLVLKVVPLTLRLLSKHWKRKNSREMIAEGKYQQKKGKRVRKEGR